MLLKKTPIRRVVKIVRVLAIRARVFHRLETIYCPELVAIYFVLRKYKSLLRADGFCNKNTNDRK